MKYLKYKIISFRDGIVTFVITEQKYRCIEFNVVTNRFTDSTGFSLVSSSCPSALVGDEEKIYVRGEAKGLDHEKMRTGIEKFCRFVRAVKEYEEKMKQMESVV